VLGLGICGICGFKDYERVIVNCKVGFEVGVLTVV
jgi:hypothetical protein